MKRLGKKFIISLFLLVIIAGVVGVWFWQKNIYSKEILKLEILGPTEAQALDEIEYTVKYKNNGDITLEDAKLIFEYPKYSLTENNQPLRQEIKIEDIYPGQEKTISFKARLLGKENETEVAKASLSYRPKNLKAFYESQTSFTTKISFVPLTFEMDLPSKIEPGREVSFSLNYFSTLNYPLTDIRIIVEYPSGFEFSESNPPALEKTDWEIGLLNQAEGGRIEIKGKLEGEIREQKIFRAMLGVWQENEFVLLKEVARGVEILKPRISIFQQINGQVNYIANPGDSLHYEIFFRNVGEESFSNLFLISRLEGRAFDFDTIKTESGSFQQGDNSITWDGKGVSKLQFLSQGEEGKVEFWINLKKDWDITSPQDKNFTLKNKVILPQVTEDFDTKINSKLEIQQLGFYEDETFGNQGPFPPQTGQSTSYTIIWQAKNYYNDVNNIKVKAILPADVRLTGKIFPQDSRLTFDSQSREIVWEVGNLEAGKGVLNEAPNVAFQIEFRSNTLRVGETPEIIGEARITGQDAFTEEMIQSIAPALNTLLAGNPIEQVE
jgi:hypothetical protein